MGNGQCYQQDQELFPKSLLSCFVHRTKSKVMSYVKSHADVTYIHTPLQSLVRSYQQEKYIKEECKVHFIVSIFYG
jgi:hypothetical protein